MCSYVTSTVSIVLCQELSARNLIDATKVDFLATLLMFIIACHNF